MIMAMQFFPPMEVFFHDTRVISNLAFEWLIQLFFFLFFWIKLRLTYNDGANADESQFNNFATKLANNEINTLCS